jgi:hypothetical protein
MNLRCALGIHDWRIRERLTLAARVMGVDVREQFRQCRRCDRTQRYYREEPILPPEPMPWRDGE